MAGLRPVCELQYDAFSYPALDQLITHVGRYRWRTGGKMGFPLTVRMPYGGGVRAPELHDHSPEAYYVHPPGGEVPEGDHVVPLGKARTVREGTDVTLVAYGAMVPLCEQAADALEGRASV